MSNLILPGSIAEIGGIRIGTLDAAKVASGKGFPAVKLDHFILTTPERGRDGVLVPDDDLMDALRQEAGLPDGDPLKEIPIILPSNNIEDVLQLRYEWWPGKSRIGAATNNLILSDKQLDKRDVRITFHINPKTGKELDRPEVREWKDEYLDLLDEKGKPLLKLTTTLGVLIASPSARFGGLYRYRSHGWFSANQLLGSLQHIKHQLTCGILRGPPFKLCVRPKTCRPIVDGKAVVSTVYVVHIECMGSDLLALRKAAREHALYERENFRLVSEIEVECRAIAGRVPVEDDAGEEVVAAKQLEQPKPQPAASVTPTREDILGLKIDEAPSKGQLDLVWKMVADENVAGDLDNLAYKRLAIRANARRKWLAEQAAQQSGVSEPPEGTKPQESKPSPPARQGDPENPPPTAPGGEPSSEPDSPPDVDATPLEPTTPPGPEGKVSAIPGTNVILSANTIQTIPVQVVAEPPPDHAGKNLLDILARQMHTLGTSWHDTWRRFAHTLGLKSVQMGDLTAGQALRLKASLQDEIAARSSEKFAGVGVKS